MLIRKAKWIAEELNEDQEDVYDVLLGNIKGPSSFVASVESQAYEYDRLMEKNSGPIR